MFSVHAAALYLILAGAALFGGAGLLGFALRGARGSGVSADAGQAALPPAPEMPPVTAPPGADGVEPGCLPAEMPEQAGRDALTGLPSRRVFATLLQDAVRRADTGGACSTVLLIDIEGRQRMIRQHGQSVGNRALRAVARRLEAMLKESETLARLGDDAFAVIAEGHSEIKAHRDAASRLAKRMVSGIRQPVAANDTGLYFGANIGVALCRPGGAGGSALLQEAAGALHRARARATGFGLAGEAQEEGGERSLEQDLLRAIAGGEIRPYYQPVIDLKTNRIVGFEALARWRHTRRGFVPPDVFVPLLEAMDMMPELTGTMLRQVCADIRLWPEDLRVAVNVSPSELSDTNLPGRILRIAEMAEVAPARLGVEITENALIKDNAIAKANLQALRQSGIMTALDDFGTGYASLTQLRQLQFDCLKIDRSFVEPMLRNGDCEKIVDAVLGLARSLDLRVVAEGIPCPRSAAALATRGCEFGQGNYFAKAVSAAETTAMLKSGPYRLHAA